MVAPRWSATDARMQPVGGSAVTLRPTIVEVIEGHRLRWLGRLVSDACSMPSTCSSWSRAALRGRAWCNKKSSVVYWFGCFSGRWIVAHCRRSRR